MYVLKYARGRRVFLTPLGQGLGPAAEPDGPVAQGTVIDAGDADDGILVRIDEVPEGFPEAGWFRADLFVLHGGYRLLGWGRTTDHGNLRFVPRGQPEVLFQRSSARVPLQLRVLYMPVDGEDDLASTGSEGLTQDLSADGAAILGRDPVSAGARLRIEFADPPLNDLGPVIARVRSASPAADEEWAVQLGLHFETIDDDQRLALRRIVAEHARSLTRRDYRQG